MNEIIDNLYFLGFALAALTISHYIGRIIEDYLEFERFCKFAREAQDIIDRQPLPPTEPYWEHVTKITDNILTDGQGWWFLDETENATGNGPYETEAEAIAALDDYCAWLDQPSKYAP